MFSKSRMVFTQSRRVLTTFVAAVLVTGLTGWAQAAARPGGGISCQLAATMNRPARFLMSSLARRATIPMSAVVRQTRATMTGGAHVGAPIGFHDVSPKQSLRDLAGSYTPLVEASAHRYGVSPRIVAAVVHVETHANPRIVVSSAGAIGPMQLMPTTARKVLNVNAWNRRQNISGGAHYLAMLISRFGSVRKALVAYNAGPSAVVSGHPPPQSIRYADRVIALAGSEARKPRGHGLWVVIAQNDSSATMVNADLN